MFTLSPDTSSSTNDPSSSTRWIVGGVCVAVLLLVIVVVALRSRSTDAPSLPNRPASQVKQAEKKAEPNSESVSPAPVFAPDADGDGVPDTVEQEKGTDPNDGDTDDDGYSDREEIFDRKSDPKKPDPPLVHPSMRAS